MLAARATSGELDGSRVPCFSFISWLAGTWFDELEMVLEENG